MSFTTTDSQPQPTTKSGSKTDGRFRSDTPPHNHSGSLVPEPVGFRWGLVELVSQQVERVKGHRYVRVRCTGCRTEKLTALDSLRARKTNGCQSCSQKCGAPTWLLQRLEAARQRCTNPKDQGFKRYGARGIKFNFPSVATAAVWVAENLGLQQGKELDRIENSGHYEPGNLRWATRRQNVANQDRSKATRFHIFRAKHPDVMYADNTLRNLIARGLTDEQIVERWGRPSCKPKGVYGTFSTAAPEIVSLRAGA